MKHVEKQTKKVCSLYVNDWHLTTMMLPHINQTIKENKQIITILEEGIKDNIQEILTKMNLKQETNEKILNIDWTSNKMCKYEKIKKQDKQKDKTEIIVKGTRQYIENANKEIEKLIKEIKAKDITIINCYNISNNQNVNDILTNHSYILNTQGIKKVEEMFKIDNQNKESAI